MPRLKENESINNNTIYENTAYKTNVLYWHKSGYNDIPSRKGYTFAKRVFDIVFSLMALVALSPVMLLIAIAIVIDDPHGGPIYVSRRCGKDGKEFNFYKFRSMCVDAEARQLKLYKYNEADGPVFKIKNDPRKTRIGSILRKVNLDELPQLFNVLCGHMSIVGPRPPIPNEVKQYTPYQMERLSVTPGLTCYWQVQPERNSLSFNQWVNWDIKYINERSFALDIKLVLKTILVVLKREGQ